MPHDPREFQRIDDSHTPASSPEVTPWTAAQWLGIGLFCLPFLVIPVTIAVSLLGGPLALVPAVPLSFAASFVGFALLIIASLGRGGGKRRGDRLRAGATRGGERGTGSVGSRGGNRGERGGGGPVRPGQHGRSSGGMRGDHPDSYGPEFASGWAAGRLARGGPEQPALIRCDHCAVWVEASPRGGVSVCPRCGAALDPS